MTVEGIDDDHEANDCIRAIIRGSDKAREIKIINVNRNEDCPPGNLKLG